MLGDEHTRDVFAPAWDSLTLAWLSNPCKLIRYGVYLNRILGPRDEHVRCRKGLFGGDAAWTDFRIFCFLKPEIDVIDSAQAFKTLLISTET